jgi:hypothetical protein
MFKPNRKHQTIMSRCKTVLHKATKIYYIDFSGLRTPDEIAEVMSESKTHIRNQPPKSMITLANIEGMHFNGSIKDLFIEFVKGNKEFVQHSAIIGVDGLRRIVFNGVIKMTGRDIRCLGSFEDAINWLVDRKVDSSVTV